MLRLPGFLDIRHMKVVSLSALRTGRTYLPGDIPGTHLCYGLSLFQGYSAVRYGHLKIRITPSEDFNPLTAELNPIRYLLALLGAHHFLHVSRIRVKSLTLRLLMSYIYIWSTNS